MRQAALIGLPGANAMWTLDIEKHDYLFLVGFEEEVDGKRFATEQLLSRGDLFAIKRMIDSALLDHPEDSTLEG